MTSCRIRQIYFSSSQIGFLDPLWHPYLNEGLTPYFENEVLKTLYLTSDHVNSDYYGVFSPKFKNKHHKDGKHIDRAMKMDEYSNDVYSFFGMVPKFVDQDKPNGFFDTFHPHLLELGTYIVKDLFNKHVHEIETERIYYNHWIAKSEIFDSYCKECLLPAIELLEGKYRDLAWENATYRPGRNISGQIVGIMSDEQCLEAFSVPYYTHHTFVVERLPSIYFALKGHSVKHI